ncbi:acyltransferase [Corallococcus praedator]|uniref:Acyltransferase n=1 Tax=Corallococcus praedator TaxID=2316724 RepID=A0ABX9QSB1_9BACT|nr:MULTISPECIES: acyltransferase [Corallococcus]RKH21764.1 acyltransferase [Corallococcus sp. CA047B]RKH36561.1 acyltransferase [Corallococcus sp. CA031C]RKI17726.1 acyltransferase [Corallococcus praedator]
MRSIAAASDANHPRLVELDALRGLAALAVALYHFTAEYSDLYGHSVPLWGEVRFGKFGVQLFFAISGFVILMSLERIERAREFVLSRAARLYPAYWTAVVLTFMVVSLFGLPDREFSLQTALVNLTMFHELLRVPHVDTVYWTLTIELSFYLLMFMLAYARALPRIIPIFIVLVALQTLAELAFQAKGMPFVARLASRPHLQFFALGVLAFKQSRGQVSVPSALALVGVCFAHEALVGSIAPLPVFGVVLVLTYALSHGALRWLTWRPLLFMGFISYSFYLVHQNIGYVIIRRLEAAGWRPEAAIAVAFAVGFLLATLITYRVEQPALRGYRQWRRKAQARAAVSPHVA